MEIKFVDVSMYEDLITCKNNIRDHYESKITDLEAKIERMKNCYNCSKRDHDCTLISSKCKDWEIRT